MHDQSPDPPSLPLIESTRPYLKSLARSILSTTFKSTTDASDIVQQTLLLAHRNFLQFRGQTTSAFHAWLKTILTNQVALLRRQSCRERARNHLPRANRLDPPGRLGFEQIAVSTESSVSSRLVRDERNRLIQAALERLTPDQRNAIELRYLRGLSVLEVAEQLGKSPAATAGLIRRAHKTLQLLLNPPASASGTS
jgi:RNA polymerase sigma-70 factor (ECF subfamily)